MSDPTIGAGSARSAPGWVAALTAAKRAVEAVLFAVVAALMASLVVVIGLQVFFRYVVNDSLAWTDEVARLLLVWTTFVGAGLASFRGVHLRLDLLGARAGPVVRRAAAIVVTALVLVFLGVLATGNLDVIEVRESIPFTSFDLSSKYLSYAISAGALLMAAGSVVSLLLALAGGADRSGR